MASNELAELLDKVKPGYGVYADTFLQHGYNGASLSVCHIAVPRLDSATLLMVYQPCRS
jgi:hypothetical protein